jgi:membrane protein required for colicin V production
MIIDLIVLVILVLAVIKGYQRGLIVGLFSFIAIIIGLAAAIKLSAVVAVHLGRSVKVSERWLPLLSFFLVFLVIVLLVRLGAKLIQRSVELVMLGWVNRLGGVVFYLAIYIAVFSVFLFYIEKMNLLKPDTISKSETWPYVHPWGPKIIDGLGTIIPFFKNMFAVLEQFFGGIAHKISAL